MIAGAVLAMRAGAQPTPGTATVIMPIRADSGVPSARALTVMPTYNPLTDATNWDWSAQLIYYSTNTVAGWGTNVAVMNLTPNTYTLTLAGAPGQATLTVTTNNVGQTNWAAALAQGTLSLSAVGVTPVYVSNFYYFTNTSGGVSVTATGPLSASTNSGVVTVSAPGVITNGQVLPWFVNGINMTNAFGGITQWFYSQGWLGNLNFSGSGFTFGGAWPVASTGGFLASGGSTFSGSGSNLTSLNASQLTYGTVPAAVLSGVGITNLPVAYVFPSGVYVVGGVSNNPGSTLTCGIQETLNALAGSSTTSPNSNRLNGGTMVFAPGNYNIYTNVVTPPGAWNTFHIIWQGSGRDNTSITYLGATVDAVIKIGTHAPMDVTSFEMRDMTVSCASNFCGNIIWFNGAQTTNLSGAVSGTIERCTIQEGTNVNWNSAWVEPATNRNLIGVNVDANFNNPIWIKSCLFNYLNTGISYASDWGGILDNQFLYTGNNGRTNQWPNTSLYNVGADIVLRDTSSVTNGGIGTKNGHQGWTIRGNQHVSSGPFYLDALTTYTPSSGWYYIRQVLIENDSSESGGIAAVSIGGSMTFRNPRFYASIPGFVSCYLLTNATVTYSLTSGWQASFPIAYTNYAATLAPTNLVTIIEDNNATNTAAMAFGGQVTAPTLLATAGLKLATNGAAPAAVPGVPILWSSNNVLYWVTTAHTNYVTGP